MFAIEYLKKEHDVILSLNNRIENESINIIEGKELDILFFRNVITFIREFADKEHHKKEEDILFKYMIQNLGGIAEKLIKNGMLVEHDMARYYVIELEKALDEYEKEQTTKSKLYIITNAMNYAQLLRRHIDKENNVVYTFAEKNLDKDVRSLIEEETKKYIEEENKKSIEKEELILKLGL